jgi:hypothetical protein
MVNRSVEASHWRRYQPQGLHPERMRLLRLTYGAAAVCGARAAPALRPVQGPPEVGPSLEQARWVARQRR